MKYLSTIAFMLCWLHLFAQPVNDDCAGLIDLGIAPACPSGVFYTNVNATPSDIGIGNIPNCFAGNTVQNDVWFSFTTSDTIIDYTITITGVSDGPTSALSTPQLALYRGDCEVNGLAQLACASADLGDSRVEMDVTGLTPNITYYLRVTDYSPNATPNWGSFQVCVDEIMPINLITEGGSTACSGELYDSGGPDGDYGNFENHVYTICPEDVSSCIKFSLEYYNIEQDIDFITDQLIIYDGDSPNPNTILAQIGGADFGFGEVIGGGAVCLEVQASSGCITVQFLSDFSVTMEGFKAFWECTVDDCPTKEVLEVTGGISEQQIIDFIATPQTEVTIRDINCPSNGYGIFQATDQTDLGLNRGLLLTSGSLNWAVGPNNDPGVLNPFADNDGLGDDDLDYLSNINGNGILSHDACVIELDVVASTNELTFEYIFASEEYPEFVNEEFNDIFAFLISGPGIDGDPNIDNQKNIAILPDGNDTPVQINSVNNLTNWEYYRNNANSQTIQYDGMTTDFNGIKKSLTTRAQVQACSTYQLKLAIADREDWVFDSGVFISEIRSGTPKLSVRFNSGVDYLVESCTENPDEILITLDQPLDQETSYGIIVSGSAQEGIDYTLEIPDTITFLPGQTEFQFPIFPLGDMIDEGIENIEISLVSDFGCGDVSLSNLSLNLFDGVTLEIEGGDTLLVCSDSSFVLTAMGAATYFWSPVELFNDPTSPTPTVTTSTSQWVFLEGSAGDCMETDSIFIQVVDPEISVSALDPTDICEGDIVRLEVSNNTDGMNISWSPEVGLSDPNSATPEASPSDTTQYFVTLGLPGCMTTDSITINVQPFDFPEIIPDTTICQNFSVVLAENLDTSTTTTYSWSPTDFLDNPTSSAPVATPETTTTYTLTATNEDGSCVRTGSVTVTVVPANVEITNPDTVQLCLDESIELNATASESTPDSLVWSPNDGSLSNLTGFTTTATPLVSTTYYASFSVGECTVVDSIFVRVDSLPDLTITADPEKDPYCQGETVVLQSEVFEPFMFPDIEHMWLQGPGFETGDSLWNMVITTQDTFVYQRITTNNACVDTAEITINVIVPPPISIIPANPEICPGESVQLMVEYEEGPEPLSWEPTDGLSCTDCPDPVASPTVTTNYTVMADIESCPPTASVVVTVKPLPSLLPNPATICIGEGAVLNLEPNPETTQYMWTSPDIPGFSSTEPAPFVTPNDNTTYNVMAFNDCDTIISSVLIQVVPEASLTVPEDQSICAGESISLTADGSAVGVEESYLWQFNPSGQTLTGATVSAGPGILVEGTNTVTVQYTYGPNCRRFDTFIITVNPLPMVMVPTDTEICEGDAIILNTNPEGDVTYTWTSPDDPNFLSNDPAPVVMPSVSTNYAFVATRGECTQEGNFVVTVIPDVSITLPASLEICPGDDLVIEPDIDPADRNFTEFFLWEWNNQSASTEALSLIGADALRQSTTINLNYTDAGGCNNIDVSTNVIVSPEPILEAILVDGADLDTLGEIPQGTEVTIELLFANPGVVDGATYTWTLDGEVIATTQTPVLTDRLDVIPNTLYTVTITLPNGCTFEEIVDIPVKEPQYRMPNAFTPDNDGANDFFTIVFTGESIEIVEFQIWNRWGSLVFDEADLTGWDGEFNGNPAPSDVYVYLISFRLPSSSSEVITLKGDVTLLR